MDTYGWEVVPLHPNPKSTEASSSDEVVRHLGYAPLWEDWEKKATNEPDALKEWRELTEGTGTRLPHVYLGVKTGKESNLVVLEVTLDEGGRSQIERWQESYGSLPETAALFEERTRKFYFFRYPHSAETLPRWFGGPSLRFHGESSLVRVPLLNKRRSKLSWDLQGPEEPAAPPSWLVDHFRCLSPGQAEKSPTRTDRRESQEDLNNGTATTPVTASEKATATFGGAPSNPTQNGSSCTPLFRTGEELGEKTSKASPFLGHPWLVEDGLTILTGAPKLAGKTTWTLHAAVHLASGRDFMGFPSRSSPVVVLTDVPPRRTRGLLDELGVQDSARSQLHFLHPKDAANLHWAQLLARTYRYAEEIGAKAVFIDSLDLYVSGMGGPDPTADDRVLHQLRVQPPSGTAVFAVKALREVTGSDIHVSLEELSALGSAADVIMQMARVQSSDLSTLRFFRSVSRFDRVPRQMYGNLQQGAYTRLYRESHTQDDWIPAVSEDSSLRDARSPAPPLRTQELEETTTLME